MNRQITFTHKSRNLILSIAAIPILSTGCVYLELETKSMFPAERPWTWTKHKEISPASKAQSLRFPGVHFGNNGSKNDNFFGQSVRVNARAHSRDGTVKQLDMLVSRTNIDGTTNKRFSASIDPSKPSDEVFDGIRIESNACDDLRIVATSVDSKGRKETTAPYEIASYGSSALTWRLAISGDEWDHYWKAKKFSKKAVVVETDGTRGAQRIGRRICKLVNNGPKTVMIDHDGGSRGSGRITLAPGAVSWALYSANLENVSFTTREDPKNHSIAVQWVEDFVP